MKTALVECIVHENAQKNIKAAIVKLVQHPFFFNGQPDPEKRPINQVCEPVLLLISNSHSVSDSKYRSQVYGKSLHRTMR